MDRLTGNIATVCVAQFVVVLDTTIVTTALPAIGPALGFAPGGLSWVITAYTVVFGALLVPFGRLADLLGPRRAFRLGTALFVGASAGCALAWAPAALVVARAVQGAGSALLSPAALALLTAMTEPGAARRKAVGWWTAAAACGGASGWVLGGLLTEFLDWRSVFWVNVPIGLLLLGVRRLPAGERRDVRVDIAGAALTIAAVGLVVYALAGVPAVTSWLLLVLAVAAAAGLVRRLRRTADPLLPVLRVAAGANLTALGLTAATTPVMYLATLYVQEVCRLSPARAALLFPVFNVAVVAASLAAPSLLRVLGARRTLLAGFATVAAGTVVFATLPAGGMPVTQLVAGFAVLGAGLGAASVASTHAGTEAAREHHGVASGALNSSAQLGTAVGLALLAPFAADYRLGFLGAGVVALAGTAAALLVPRGTAEVAVG
ncbi:MFS transporter [Actinophytocola sp.]|uniref:MFS transporter n=1 Tax=Actinophytocola sp. TaxID=1872138 RepID=UPI0038999B28